MRFLPVLLLASTVMLSGCAAWQQQLNAKYRVVAASSEKRPDWLSTDGMERDGYLFYAGSLESVRDLAQGEELAEAQARLAILKAVQNSLRQEFERAMRSSDRNLHARLDSALVDSIKDIQVVGLVPITRYWERLEVPVTDGISYTYRMSLLFRIPKSEFAHARERAYQSIFTQVASDVGASDVLSRVKRQLAL